MPLDDDCIDFEPKAPKEYKGLKFILLVDEIDAIPHDIMIEFVKTVRSIFIERLSVAGFKGYTMILCGSADLASLTYGKTSPFNISKVIYIRDFSFEEIHGWLTSTFQYLGIQFSDSFAHKLFEQTEGHPYLTQLLCFRIMKRLQKEGRNEATPDDFQEIDQIITDGDVNLLTTLERIKKDELLQEMTLKILKGDPVRYSRTHDIIYHLELAGAIRRKDEYCRIRNPIFEKFLRQYFNLTDHNLPVANFVLRLPSPPFMKRGGAQGGFFIHIVREGFKGLVAGLEFSHEKSAIYKGKGGLLLVRIPRKGKRGTHESGLSTDSPQTIETNF